MGEIIKEYVVPIGVLSTLLATFFNIYYTRKNFKTSKYIDVVTTERIKWLSIIRSEVSELISIISETLIIFSMKLTVLNHKIFQKITLIAKIIVIKYTL